MRRRAPKAAELVYRGRAFDVALVRFPAPRGGPPLRREVVCHGPSVVMLAFDARGRLLLERQYRAPVRATLWELPAGGLEPGEAPLAAARRELGEETGYSARHWRRLARFFSSPGFVDEELHVFVARDLRPGAPRLEADEAIRVRWITITQFRRMIVSGRVRDAKTLAAWSAYESRLQTQAARP